MTKDRAKVVFLPSGRRGDFELGTPVLDAARSLGVDIDSVCGGRALCGRCQVVCAEGNFQKLGVTSDKHHLSGFSETEERFGKRKKPLSVDRRLSCQARIQGDVVIDVPEESQVHRQVVRKEAEHRDIVLNTTVHLHYVEVQEANMHEAKGDVERLLESLERDWELSGLSYGVAMLQSLQVALREGDWCVTVAVHNKQKIIAVWPGYKEVVYGVAVDVGSTTIAAHLCNLTTGEVVGSGGIMNPQIRFGEDLMSRVSYVMMHPDKAEDLTRVVREGINNLIANVASQIDVLPTDVLDAVFVGNPIMHHLLLGISPVELGGAPFALATNGALNLRATDLDLEINPGARVYTLPCIAGHVGADCAGVILSEEPQLQDEVTLLVDVGTNAEIVLGNKSRLLACSSPTGPAFEGAQISCGQRAAPGAIERVRIDAETGRARFRVIGSEIWSDDPEFKDSVKQSGVTGICGSGIIEAVAEMYLAGIVSQDGVIQEDPSNPKIVRDDRTWSYVLYADEIVISVSQTDVRQIQLAKAALYAGVKLLMDKMGTDKVDRIRLAGAFGSHIDVKHAMVLGLIPDCVLENVASAGNAAGTGARIALLNSHARLEIEDIVRQIEKIETAVEDKFQVYFVDAMALPHKFDPFPMLFSTVKRPAPIAAKPTQARKRRRRSS